MPSINSNCVNCGICDKNCPLLSQKKIQNKKKEYYIAKRTDDKLRSLSQSGGAFSVFAERVLDNHGVVYGVSLNKELNAVYTRIERKSAIQKLRGSKYVQASVGKIFITVSKDLISGKKVLFSGTPCHVHGLLLFLKSKRVITDNLYTIDIICHGVVSPKLYNDYKLFFERFHNRKIKSFNFRDKQFGWRGCIVSVKTSKAVFASRDYVNLFYSHYSLRESCYECKYTNLDRVSDITIGDSWGIETHHKEFDDNKGCSLVIVNSIKGKNLFEENKNEFYFFSVEINEYLQPNLQRPTERPYLTDAFWRDYFKFGFEYVAFKYCKCNLNS